MIARIAPALAGALLAPVLLVAPASAQGNLPATGVYNCPVSVMHRCTAEKCETRKPEGQMEISIDFGAKSACMRRGGGECRQPRGFDIVESGSHYNLVFSKHAMIFRLNGANGQLVGGDVGSSSVVTVVAQCARG